MAWIFTVGVLLTGPGGVAVDKYGARLVTIVGLPGPHGGVVVLAFAETVPAAIVATTLMGVSGVTWPAFNSMVAAIVQGPLRVQYFGVNFALVNLGIGLGGVVSGLYVDVTRPGTFTTIYLVDAVSLLIPVLLLLGPLRHVHARAEKPEDTTGVPTSYWQIARQPAMAWLLLLTFIAMFVGYGQMEAGFPAFAREASEVSTRIIGWAFAANTAVIVLAAVPRAAPHRGPPPDPRADGDDRRVDHLLDRARPHGAGPRHCDRGVRRDLVPRRCSVSARPCSSRPSRR